MPPPTSSSPPRLCGERLLLFLGPIAVLLVCAALLHLAHGYGFLRPLPLLDADRTILAQKRAMAAHAAPAQLLFAGDSACLMDVDAPALARAFGLNRVANYGTISHLSLASQARLIALHLGNTPAPPKAVIFLLHPDALRREAPVPAIETAFAALLADTVPAPRPTPRAMLEWATGIHLFRETLLARLLPIPLRGPLAPRHGFTQTLRRALDDADGSLAATGTYRFDPGQGRAVYRVAKKIREHSANLATRLPEALALYTVIAPIPASFDPGGHADTAAQLNREWALAFDGRATPLDTPAVLPDPLFADRFHLNKQGRTHFTQTLAETLHRRAAEIAE